MADQNQNKIKNEIISVCKMRDLGYEKLEKWFGFDYNDGDDNVDKNIPFDVIRMKTNYNVINGSQLR